MTPFGERLRDNLEREFSRIANEWFVRWHELLRGKSIDLDDFSGGRIRFGSGRFDVHAEHAFWKAVRRYLMQQIQNGFARAQLSVGLRLRNDGEAIADDTAAVLRAFCDRVFRFAIYTEYRLMQRGFPDEKVYLSRRDPSFELFILSQKLVMAECSASLSCRFSKIMGEYWHRFTSKTAMAILVSIALAVVIAFYIAK